MKIRASRPECPFNFHCLFVGIPAYESKRFCLVVCLFGPVFVWSWVFLVAGFLVVISWCFRSVVFRVMLSVFFRSRFLLVVGFVGRVLFQSGFRVEFCW